MLNAGVGSEYYQFKDSLGNWEKILVPTGYVNDQYSLMVNQGDVEIGYFDQDDDSLVLVDDITGKIDVKTIQQVQAR